MTAGLDQKQLLVVIAGAALLLVAGVLAWLGLGGLGEKQAEAQALADRMSNPALAALLVGSGGAERASRDAAELHKLAQNLREKDLAATRWSQSTQELSGEGQDWAKDPGKWKDRLITVSSQLQKDAKLGKVSLAPDFYLGLEAYRQKSPTPEQVPGLALHLAVAERLARLLLEARKVAEQYPTGCELRILAGPGSVPVGEDPEKPVIPPSPGSPPGASLSVAERKSFRVEVRSSPEVLYEYVRRLALDPALFIVTDLSVANEKQTFPLRSEIAKRFSGAVSAEGTAENAKPAGKKLLEVLAGEESLDAALEVDFVTWKESPQAKPQGAPPASP